MSSSRFNLNNPAVKRILQEVKEMQNNPSDDYMSLPLEDNIFEWQFAIRGPRDTEFEGGIYHGRIQLPAEYPLKPPAFMLLTSNGRFETQTKICLSISQYHPEHWQPSWSVRTALVALIAFMPTKGNGAIGSLEFTKEERMALALKSVEAPPKYGNAERQRLIDEIHAEMLKRTAHVSKESGKDAVSDTNKEQEVAEGRVDSMPMEGLNVGQAVMPAEVVDDNELVTQPSNTNTAEVTDGSIESRPTVALPTEPRTVVAPAPGRANTRQQASDDYFLTSLAIGLMVAIVALMIRKFYHSFSWVSFK